MKTGIFNLSGFHFSTLILLVKLASAQSDPPICNSTQTTRYNECIILQNGAEAAIATCNDYKSNRTDNLNKYVDECKSGFADAGQFAGSVYFNDTNGCKCAYTQQINWENDKVNPEYLSWCDSDNQQSETLTLSKHPKNTSRRSKRGIFSEYVIPCNHVDTCSGSAEVDCQLFASAAAAGYYTCIDATKALLPNDNQIEKICEGMMIHGGSMGAQGVQNENNCCCPVLSTTIENPALVFSNPPTTGTGWCKNGEVNKRLKNFLIIKKTQAEKKALKYVLFQKFKSNGGFDIVDFFIWKKLFKKHDLRIYLILNLIEGNS